MSVMGDKGPNPWQYPMYGGYPSPYQQFQAYQQPNFYNYYHEAMQFGPMNGGPPVNHMMQGPLKHFTPGGQLQPFNNQEQDADKEQKGERNQELPPLPPGPPPPPQPSPPGSSAFYQQSGPGLPGPSGGPVRFNMARPPRPQFNNQPFNNSGSSKKKRKKKNKFNQNQNQNQNQGPQQSQGFAPPPLPPHQMIRPPAPPLPPGPPPAAPQPPPEEVKPPQTEPRPPQNRPANILENRTGQEWPKELFNYINKCYARCQNDVDKDRVSIILKGKILRATNDDTLWIKDWASEPLPLLQSEMDKVSVQPVFTTQEGGAVVAKKRLSLANRLGARVRSRSRSRSNSRSRSPNKPKQRTPPSARNRRRRDRSGSSGSENDWTPPPPTNKKAKGRNSEHFGKQEMKRKNKGKGRGHFYSEFGENDLPVNSELLEKRAARFSSGGGNNRRNNKMKAFNTTVTVTNTNTSLMVFEDTSGDFDLEDCHVIGVCQDIEKPYLRLTTAPEASAVRPPEVLKQSLSRVKERWVKDQDYHYACEQLKSIRQDLTVQGIRDRLTVSVYETHARIALEKGDHAEFNQCQSQLKLLYDELPTDNRCEFTAYRILYFIFTKENMDLNTVMTSLSALDCQDECIRHALDVRSAWALNNYHKLFRLYRNSPRMSSYLMEWFLPRERKMALKTVIKAYRQTLPVSWLTQELAFGSDSECLEFLSQFSVVYADDERTKIDCKTSAATIGSA